MEPSGRRPRRDPAPSRGALGPINKVWGGPWRERVPLRRVEPCALHPLETPLLPAAESPPNLEPPPPPPDVGRPRERRRAPARAHQPPPRRRGGAGAGLPLARVRGGRVRGAQGAASEVGRGGHQPCHPHHRPLTDPSPTCPPPSPTPYRPLTDLIPPSSTLYEFPSTPLPPSLPPSPPTDRRGAVAGAVHRRRLALGAAAAPAGQRRADACG
jgi:hypothetical protein